MVVKLISDFLKEHYTQFSILSDDRERAILALREQGKTLQEIGDVMHITRERVRQLEEKAKLRKVKGGNMVRDLYEQIKLFFFDEREVEDAFLSWYSKEGGVLLDSRNKWKDFNKIMWDNKDDLHSFGDSYSRTGDKHIPTV